MTRVAGSRVGRRSHRPLSDMNVTPLVDVMLVLLVVFMVTAPMLAAGLKVDLPVARSAKPLPPEEPVVVSIGRDGGIAIGDESVELDRLVARLVERTAGDRERTIRVKGDQDAAYRAVMSVVDGLATGGFSHVALVTKAPPSRPTLGVPPKEENGEKP